MKNNSNMILKILPFVGAFLVVLGNIIAAGKGNYSIFSGALIILGAILFLSVFIRIESRNVPHYINLIFFCLFVLGSFILLYLIANNHQISWDLTKIKAYSLSPQTIQYLKSLDRDILLNAFVTDSRTVEDFLKQYKKYSDHIKIEIYNPLKDVLIAKQYANEIGGEIADGDLIVKCDKRKKKIHSFSEESLTNAIVEVQREKPIKVYFLVGHGEHPLGSKDSSSSSRTREDKRDPSLSLLIGKLEERGVVVEELNIARKGFVPEDCSVVVSAGPFVDYFPYEITALKEYLEKGGKAIFMLDPSENVNESFSRLRSLLEEYGAKLKDDIVIDPNPISFGMNQDPFSPLVSEYNSEHTITKPLKEFSVISFLIPKARSIGPREGLPPSISVSPLLYSSEMSWSEDIKKLFETKKVKTPEDKSLIKKQPLAVAITKDSTSGKEEDQTKIVIFGDSDIFTNDLIIQQIPAILFFNVFHWLTAQKDLIAIPPKTFEETPIILSQPKSRWLYLSLVMIFPGLIFFGGLGYTLYRRKTR